MAQELNQLDGIGVQGTVPAIVSRVRNMYVQEVWIRCPKDRNVLEKIKAFIKEQRQIITSQRGNGNLQILFDVDPV